MYLLFFFKKITKKTQVLKENKKFKQIFKIKNFFGKMIMIFEVILFLNENFIKNS